MLQRLLLGLASVALLMGAHDVAATAQRTFVASYGLTANTAVNCSIAKPCRAFSEAISVTTPGGEVIVLDSAGYGAVTINQAVSIIAPPGIYAGISVFGGYGVTVNAPGAIVVLRGLSINGLGGFHGISLQAAQRLRVENCVISKMPLDGINHTATSAELIVLDTIIRDNGGTGIGVGADLPSIVLHHVRIEHNAVDGLRIEPTAGSVGALATIADSVFTHNGGNGIAADSVSGATFTTVIERSVMASNGQNGFVANTPTGSAGSATVSRSAVNDNGGNGISILGGGGDIYGAAFENAVHRNSGIGIRLEGITPGHLFAVIKGNIAHSNGGGDLLCLSGVALTDKTSLIEVSTSTCGIQSGSF